MRSRSSSGELRNNFTLGQAIALTQDAPGTLGELSAGRRAIRPAALEAFVRGELDFGGERDGLPGRAGVTDALLSGPFGFEVRDAWRRDDPAIEADAIDFWQRLGILPARTSRPRSAPRS